MQDIQVVTTNDLPGKKVKKVIGGISAITVYSPGFSRGIVGGLSSLARGEVDSFSKTLEEAREQVIGRLVEDAKQSGANAILAVRFDSNTFNGLMEIYAYGTAVIVE